MLVRSIIHHMTCEIRHPQTQQYFRRSFRSSCNTDALESKTQHLVRPDAGGAGASICYIPSVIDKVDADHLFHWLLENVEWRRENDNFGPQDRLSAYFGDAECTFSYVGLTLKPRPWPTPMLKVRQQLEARLAKDSFLSGITCSACLVNNYPPGEGQIVWHHDEIRAHGPRPLIASVSLSPHGERSFELRRRAAAAGGDPTSAATAAAADLSLSLAHGSALIMAGSAQEGWLHRLPLSGPDAPHRISLTFRSIIPGFEDALAAAAAADCTS
jgi:alkylated DNA repair dioxygenase AlkB